MTMESIMTALGEFEPLLMVIVPALLALAIVERVLGWFRHYVSERG